MTRTDLTATEDAQSELPEGFKRRLFRQLATELGPLLFFFVVFMWKDIIWATGLYAGATLIALAMTMMTHRKVPVLPLISAALVAIFAGLTILLNEDTFIKIKPTVVNAFYGLVVGVGWFAGFRLIEKVLEPECSLDEEGLRTLSIRVAIYLIGLAILNEIVWRTFSTDVWVVFKVFVIVAFNLVFAWTQFPLVRDHLQTKSSA